MKARKLHPGDWVVLPPGDAHAGRAARVLQVDDTSAWAVRVSLESAGVRFWEPNTPIEVADGRLMDA